MRQGDVVQPTATTQRVAQLQLAREAIYSCRGTVCASWRCDSFGALLYAEPCPSCTSPRGMMLAQRAEVACGGHGVADADVWVEAPLCVADLAGPVVIGPPHMSATGHLVGNGGGPGGVDARVPVSEAVCVGHPPDRPDDHILQETVTSRGVSQQPVCHLWAWSCRHQTSSLDTCSTCMGGTTR